MSIHKPAPIPEISRLSLPVNLSPYRRVLVIYSVPPAQDCFHYLARMRMNAYREQNNQ